MKLKQLFLLLAGVALTSLASPGYAFDYKTYPGSQCQPVIGGDAVSFTRGNGSIYHANEQAVPGVTCPIIRDRVPHENQPSDRTGLDVGIWFTFAANKIVECRFISVNESGNRLYTSPPQVTNRAQNGPQALYWNVSPEQTPIDGTYSIDCSLPATVRLLRYIVGEDLDTDNGF
jgi:hypothetical protein